MKACTLPPTMKVSVAAVAPPTPPDTGASSIMRPFFSAAPATARAVSTSMVEQSISSVPSLAFSIDAGGAEIDLAHFLARRQHGDDHVGARGRALGGLDAGAAGRHEFGDRGRIDVHALDLVAGLDEVLRHRQTHIAEPDKSYARHGALPDLFCFVTAAAPAPISTPARDKARAVRLPTGRSAGSPPNTCGKNISTASIEAIAVSQITAPQAAASQSPTAATRSITAKNTVAACQAME